MGNRLVITVKAKGEVRLAMFWQWEASCFGEFFQKCTLVRILDKDDSLEDMLRKICYEYKDSGLVVDSSWWKDLWGDNKLRMEFFKEIVDVRKMIEAGIPEVSSRCDGAIAITPVAIELMCRNAEWVSELDLDNPDFSIRDCMWTCEDPSDYEEEDEIFEMTPRMKTKITKDNAMDLYSFFLTLDEGFYEDEETKEVYQLC